MPDRATVDRMLPRVASLVLGCLLIGGMAIPVRAADAGRPLPDEPGAQFLDGSAFGAIVADLDGDGTRELVRLVPQTNAPGILAVDGWRVSDGGTWSRLGEQRLERAASVNEILSERPAQRNPMRPVGVGEPARFLTWNDGKRERLLVATIATSLDPIACCLTVWEVVIGVRGALTMRLMLSTQGNATSIRSLDLDGDPADELFVTRQPDPRGPDEVPIRVYDWNGSSFDEARSSFIAPPGWTAFAAGDTDGRPGGEVLISSDPIDNGGDAVLNRVWLEHGSVRSESWSVRDRGAVTSFDAGDGPRIAIVPPEAGLALILDWPPRQPVKYEAASAVLGRLVGVLGSGPGTRLLIAGLGGSGFRMVDPLLRPAPAPPLRGVAISFVANGLPPYSGPLPGGLGGEPAFIYAGRLIDQTAASGLLEPLATRPMAALPGITPIGVAGPHGSWMVLLHDPAFEPARDGGALTAPMLPFPARISVAPTAQVLSPERDDGRLEADFVGAVPGVGSGGQLATKEQRFTVKLGVPQGSSVLQAVGSLPGPLGETLRAPTLTGDQLSLEIDVPPESESGDRFSLRLGVVTPVGHGYTAQWTVTLLRDPPPLTVETPVAPFSLSVPLAGMTRPGTSVAIDDRSVLVAADGSFVADVDASLLPTDVRIVATDAVGNTATEIASVVGFVDYRRLPWIPVVVVLTIVAAIVLFLRAPRPRARPAPAPDDDARLEEID